MKANQYTTICILQNEYPNNQIVLFNGKYYII